jgi:acid stress-induced BolA-like protein IbaG/YrbA
MKKRRLPPAITRLKKALASEFGAVVDVQPVPGGSLPDYFRVALVSTRFARMPHLKRQDAVWDVADRILSREEVLSVSMILAFAPNELESQAVLQRAKARTKAVASR